MIFYGLKTCDTCRKARKALDAAGVDYSYTDVRDDGVAKKDLTAWAKQVGWEKLLNKSSTTWRALDDADKENLSEKKAVDLMAANPTLIKRPVIVRGATEVFVGWSKETQDAVLG
jgi:arsenate reductase